MENILNITWEVYKPINERYEEVEKEIERIREQGEIYEDGKDRELYKSLIYESIDLRRKVTEMRPHLIPEVGVPCTVHFYSDRSSGYVLKVISPKKILVKMDGIYTGTKIFTYRRNGHWVQFGTTSRDWGTLCTLGYRSNYYDREF